MSIARDLANVASLVIASGSNVGIGTSSSSAKLNVVHTTTGDALRVTNTGTGNSFIVEDSTNPDISPFVITSDGKVGVGIYAPSSKLVVNGNSAELLPAPVANTNFEVHGADGAPNRIAYVAYGGSGGGITGNATTFAFRRSNGTAASPTALANNDAIGVIGAQGYDGTSWTLNRSAIFFYAANTWTTTSTPTRLQFSTTPDGSNTSVVRVTLNESGNVGLNTEYPIARLDVSGNQAGNIIDIAALDIDCSQSNYFRKTINGASTFTFSNPPASRAYGFTLELTVTSGSVTWPTTVRWPGNTAPTITANTHLFTFLTDDGGSRWRGSSLLNYQA